MNPTEYNCPSCGRVLATVTTYWTWHTRDHAQIATDRYDVKCPTCDIRSTINHDMKCIYFTVGANTLETPELTLFGDRDVYARPDCICDKPIMGPLLEHGSLCENCLGLLTLEQYQKRVNS